MVTAESLVSHSWFRYTPGRLPTVVVAFGMGPGLLRGPGVHFGVVDLQQHSKVDFVWQSKLATDPHDGTTTNRMSQSARPVRKVVDQVSGDAIVGICDFLGNLIRTGRL